MERVPFIFTKVRFRVFNGVGGETSALLFNIQDTPLQMISERGEGGESTLKKWLSNFLAGGVAGAVSRTLTAPLDRL